MKPDEVKFTVSKRCQVCVLHADVGAAGGDLILGSACASATEWSLWGLDQLGVRLTAAQLERLPVPRYLSEGHCKSYRSPWLAALILPRLGAKQ